MMGVFFWVSLFFTGGQLILPMSLIFFVSEGPPGTPIVRDGVNTIQIPRVKNCQVAPSAAMHAHMHGLVWHHGPALWDFLLDILFCRVAIHSCYTANLNNQFIVFYVCYPCIQ